MQKLFSLLLALAMVFSLSVTAFAEGETTGTTTLTTEVPDDIPSWTLTVPATGTVPHEDTSHVYIGDLSVSTTSSKAFNVFVTPTYAAFSDGSGHTIPYKLECYIAGFYEPWNTGEQIIFPAIYSAPEVLPMYVIVDQSDWDAVASYPGTYTSVITFTSSFNDWW